MRPRSEPQQLLMCVAHCTYDPRLPNRKHLWPGKHSGSVITLVFDVVNGVTQPSTWAMVIAGFLGLGLMACRKNTSLRFA
jgi:hypothetical protein